MPEGSRCVGFLLGRSLEAADLFSPKWRQSTAMLGHILVPKEFIGPHGSMIYPLKKSRKRRNKNEKRS